MASGKNEIPQRGQCRFQGINPCFHGFDVRLRDHEGARSGALGIGEDAADAEQVVLYSAHCVPVRLKDRMVEQSSDHGIQFIDGAVCFDAGVVLVDAGTIEQGGLPSVTGAGVDAHVAKVRFRTQPAPRGAQEKNGGKYLRGVHEAKQRRYDMAYLRMAREWAMLSHCRRKQVGALIVRDGMIVSDGYNGTPSGFPNACEDEDGSTHWYVLHAEANAITKLARSNHTAAGATLYITLSPCRECAKLIHQVGIRRLVFIHAYKDDSGLKFLNDAGVEIVRYEHVE